MESVVRKRPARFTFDPPPPAKRHEFDTGRFVPIEPLRARQPAAAAAAAAAPPRFRPPIVEEPQENFIERIINKYANTKKRSRIADDDDDDDDDDEDADKDDKIPPSLPPPPPPNTTTPGTSEFGGIVSGAKRKHDDDDDDDARPPPKERAIATALVEHRPRAISHKRQPNKLSAQSFMLQLLRADADEEADRLRNTRVHRTWEYEVLNMRFRGECIGDVRIKKKRAALEFIYENVTAPSKHQRLMHLGLEALSYASFFGEELNANLVRILREHNWSELRTEGICEAPRRFGKSRGISMDNAAEIVTQPGSAHSEYGHDVLLYANNHRASKMDLLQGYRDIKVLSADPEFGGKIESMNKNESLNFITKDGYTNTMYCYPAKPDNLRGTGSKYPTGTVIAEEFAYWPEDLFFSVLAPTLTRRNVKFFGITTVNGSDSFVTPLTTAKYPDGRSVFLCMNFQLICAECKAAHREHLCKCLLGDIPHWQSSTQHEKLSIIMERKIGKFLQEIKGLSIDETVSPAFCQVSCEFLRTPESIMPIKEIYSEIVYTAVDPACGGKYSKFAIVSAIFRDGLMIIVAADLCSSERPERQAAKLVQHIAAVRSVPGLQTSKIVFCPESNLGSEGKRFAQDLSREGVRNCFCLMEDVRGNEGVRMTDEFKKEMWMSTNALLLYRRIRWHQCMQSISDDEKFSAPRMRKLIIDELCGYQRQLIYSKSDPLAPPKERFTGKIGGVACDDHCIALQIAYKAMEFWTAKPDFYSRLKPLDKQP